MQQADNDMDDLFRKAAQDYPLKTDNADWEKVRSYLSPAAGITETASPKKDYKKFLWLLLLLPIGWACYILISHENNASKQSSLNQNNTPLNTVPALSNLTKQAKPDEKEKETNSLNAGKTFSTETNGGIGLSAYPKKNNHNLRRSINAHTTTSIVTGDQAAFDKNNDRSNESIDGKRNDLTPKTEDKTVETNDQKDNIVLKKDPNKEEKEVNNIDTLKSKNSKVRIKEKQVRGLYVGLIAGADVSTIKFQSTKKAGLNIGVIGGYQFNKMFSIESGVIWDKKFYYSEGKYFNTAKINIPANSRIQNVNGNCEMIEVPVNVKINFISSAKNNWFFVTGLSSYFMKNEDYNYIISNPWGTYPYSKKYEESSSFLLSVINMGIGYSHVISKGATLRIEPYAKIPLHGVGLGKLPITSAGINIGFTKKIFK